MLRIETGFNESLYKSSNSDLIGYTNHHRLLVPALIAHDMFHAGHSGFATEKKLEMVMEGSRRTATLAFESDNVKNAAHNVGWIAIRDEVMPDDLDNSHWRVVRRDDPHFGHPGISAWAATRTLLKLPTDVPDDVSTRVRERYTFTSADGVEEDEIRAILLENDAPEDVMIATASVYAINKLVPKPSLPDPVDMSRYPSVYETMQRR